jgi:hypothetical protein
MSQGVGESLQEFATAVEQLAQHVHPVLPEAGKAFADVGEGPAIKTSCFCEKRKR